ncbi:MAG: hypothetical protein WC169_00980 [Dehalococcoidia bacterium]|jgi:hypothetical protein
MDINSFLLTECSEYLYHYDCQYRDVSEFIEMDALDDRQKMAVALIRNIMAAHGKEQLLDEITGLIEIERGIRELEPWAREHGTHSLLTFLIGIYLNERYIKPKLGNKVDKLQWKLAGLFHDVGYPIEYASNIIFTYFERVDMIARKTGVNRCAMRLPMDFRRLTRLTNGWNSLNIIQTYLYKWDLKIMAKNELDKMCRSDRINHGIVSSLTILYLIDQMYQKNNKRRAYEDKYVNYSSINWSQEYFDTDICSACAAIYIHSLPSSSYNGSKIDITKAPLAFLLKVSDVLQEWERPSKLNISGYPANNFDISIVGDEIHFFANVETKRKLQIVDELIVIDGELVVVS